MTEVTTTAEGNGSVDPVGDGVDLRQVMAEIHDDVRKRRADGDIPPGFERELDMVFARFAPAAAVGGDLTAVVERAERASFVDVDVPTESNTPGVSIVKRVLKMLVGWYLRYLSQQTSAFASTVVRGLRIVSDRLDALEDASGASGRVREELDRVEPGPAPESWSALATSRLADAPGRVLLAEVGDGTLLGAIVGAGIDAYGVEPRRDLADRAVAAGHDVRPDEVVSHLRVVAHDSLGGVVLTRCVDRLPPATQLELADLAASRLAPGGVLLVLSHSPEGWARTASVVERDLAPGRPLHAATWRHLLAERGFASVDVFGDDDTYAVAATRTR